MIDVQNLTLKYPSGKGVFDVNFNVQKGQVMGYLGPNGAGKTTTIRALLGFWEADSGICQIDGHDCFSDAVKIQTKLGYIGGEISFLDNMTGKEYLDFISNLRKVDKNLTNSLIERFELDASGKIKKFSKGMKQKLAIISAFFHDPQILILDEPTSGLDPLMQNRFVELILEEKKKGKTILMSSHMFEEVERTCDDVLIIKDGRIVAQSDIATLKASQRKAYFIKTSEIEKIKNFGFETGRIENGTVEVFVVGERIDEFVKKLATVKIEGFDSKVQGLEDVFFNYYERGAK